MDRDSITFLSWNKVAQRYADAFMDLFHYNDSDTFLGNAFMNENASDEEIAFNTNPNRTEKQRIIIAQRALSFSVF